jgi:hypothetical protein
VSKKILTIMLALFLVANTSMVYAAKSSGSAPSTSVRSGTFSTSPGSSTKTSPSSSSSNNSFSGGASNKSTVNDKSTSGTSTPSSSVNSNSSSGFSGGSSNKSTVPSTSSSTSSTTQSGSTYSTGLQRPSSAVDGSKQSPYSGKSYYGGSTYYNNVPNGHRANTFWPVVGAFAAGTMLGSMIHPWGGYFPQNGGGYVHQPFSFLSLFLDLIALALIIGLVVFVVRRIAGRR